MSVLNEFNKESINECIVDNKLDMSQENKVLLNTNTYLYNISSHKRTVFWFQRQLQL